MLTLDDIRADAERKFGDLSVDFTAGPINFRAFLRMGEKQRKKFAALESEFRALVSGEATTATTDADRVIELMRDMLAVTADKPSAFLAEIRKNEDWPALVAVIWEHYQNRAQLGEASRSDG